MSIYIAHRCRKTSNVNLLAAYLLVVTLCLKKLDLVTF